MKNISLTIIGAGNLGMAIYKGLSQSGFLENNKIFLTKKYTKHFKEELMTNSFLIDNNTEAVKDSDIIIFCVQPTQLEGVVKEIKNVIPSKAVLVSTVTGVSLLKIKEWLDSTEAALMRAMPNTAIAVGESMTCLAAENTSEEHLSQVKSIFNQLGKTLIIPENLLQAATIICASGTAFWMRFIRASCQGAVQLGFESHIAQELVMQTCLGAVKLLENNGTHPEQEVDKVTTPAGCTVKGLNEMEHQGLTSAIIKGLETSFDQINRITKEST